MPPLFSKAGLREAYEVIAVKVEAGELIPGHFEWSPHVSMSMAGYEYTSAVWPGRDEFGCVPMEPNDYFFQIHPFRPGLRRSPGLIVPVSTETVFFLRGPKHLFSNALQFWLQAQEHGSYFLGDVIGGWIQDLVCDSVDESDLEKSRLDLQALLAPQYIDPHIDCLLGCLKIHDSWNDRTWLYETDTEYIAYVWNFSP